MTAVNSTTARWRARTRRPLVLALAALLLAAGALLWLSVRSEAIIIYGAPQAKFGLVGVAPEQTLRLGATNVTNPDGIPPDQQRECRVGLTFIDVDGSGIDDPTTRGLRPGQSTYITLPQAPTRERVEVHPVAEVERPDDCPIAFSVQVIDRASRKTTAVLGSPELATAPGR